MKNVLSIALAFFLIGSAAQAGCYADYKAKRDAPLRLHYGVAEIKGDCSVENAMAELKPRLATNDWQLLSIEGVFDDAGLEERQDSAGEYYLRY